MRLKWRRSRFSRRIMIHMVPHCAKKTGSMIFWLSAQKVMAPLQWYTVWQLRICCQGTGVFSKSLYTACGKYFKAPK
jgi:hypothetical protein